ncbi:MAG: UDP-N-acetylmuramoyl-L-alanine--D-glutamate ligase [candidate division Zixibacteria bacterium]|nr:UDP-N-acetylmuramoyl-L-alanine--D-glutamate ligase [candidate division Zixibacteria bacterium]
MRSINPQHIEDTMNRIDRLQGRQVGIIGMARSGIAAAQLVQQLGGKPYVSDILNIEKLEEVIPTLEQNNIPYEYGGHSEKLLESDYLICSPGVPASLDILHEATVAGIPIFSEIELAYWVCRGRVLAITGSNGKTTTTTLLGEICKASGRPTVVGGNIGTPFSQIARDIPENGLAVIEVSSFQLERIEQFAPYVGILLNLTPDHLDRYESFEKYCDAKYKMFENQTAEHYAVINADDPVISSREFTYSSNHVSFSIDESSDRGRTLGGVFQRGKRLVGNLAGGETDILDIDKICIPGPHNHSNAAAACAAALICGIKPDVIASVLERFAGVEHRLEHVTNIGGVDFINDSKGTNVDAVVVALKSIPRGINLIAGGRDKAGDFTQLLPEAVGKVEHMILIGEAKDIIFEQVGRQIPVVMASSMADAVKKAFDLSHPGDTVLLSPGCASFDMYRNFEERGEDFKYLIGKLKNGKGNGATVEV